MTATLTSCEAGTRQLVLVVGGQSGERFHVLGDGVTIGRAPENSVCVDHCDLRREHATKFPTFNIAQTGQCISAAHQNAAPFGHTNHRRVDLTPPCLDPLEPEHFQKLTAAAADLEDLPGPSAQRFDVNALPVRDVIVRPAELVHQIQSILL